MLKKKFQSGFVVLAITAAVLFAISPAKAVDFGISGQINRAALYADDGDDAKWFFVDSNNSSTRFRFTGSNEFDENWKVGIVWENQMESNSSSDDSLNDDGDGVIDIGSDDDVGDITFTERKMEFYIEHKKFGKLTLGQGDTASNGAAEVDLSGTDVVAYSTIGDMAGGFFFP